MGNVLSIYTAKARREINRILAEYGGLPGFLLPDLVETRIISVKYALGCWRSMQGGAVISDEFQSIVSTAVEENEGMLQAFEDLGAKFKRDYDNEIPYTNI